MVRLAAKGADRRALTKLRNFVSAIASKTRKLTSAAALPLSTARSSLETNLSRSFSTATTKHLLFRLTAFAKSQRGSHECASDLNRGYQWLLPSSPPLPSAAVATSREGSQSSRSVTFLDRRLLYWNCLDRGASYGGGFQWRPVPYRGRRPTVFDTHQHGTFKGPPGPGERYASPGPLR